MAKKKHHEHHEEHMDESWLIPYADILTLLLALFIVLFSSSQVDSKKIQKMAEAFSYAFGGNNSLFQHMRNTPTIVDDSFPLPTAKIPPALAVVDEGKNSAYYRETVELLEAKRTLDKYIEEKKMTNEVHTVFTEEGLVLRIRESALFPSGSAELVPASRQLAVQVAKMLLPLSQKVSISGHTDNVPISTAEFPSNWELSSRRAVNFMRFLLAQEPKLEPARFSAIGYGEYRPRATNNTEEGRALNRRVEVLIMRNIRQNS